MLKAIVQSPCVETGLEASLIPNLNSTSPMLSVHWLLVDMEYNPEKMLLRLMDFPWTRLSHSELGKAGHPGVLMMLTLTCFDLPTTLEVIQVLLGVQVITWIQ